MSFFDKMFGNDEPEPVKVEPTKSVHPVLQAARNFRDAELELKASERHQVKAARQAMFLPYFMAIKELSLSCDATYRGRPIKFNFDNLEAVNVGMEIEGLKVLDIIWQIRLDKNMQKVVIYQEFSPRDISEITHNIVDMSVENILMILANFLAFKEKNLRRANV